MKIVRTPLNFDLDPTSMSDCKFPEAIQEQFRSVVDQAKEIGATVDWATLCVLPEETRLDVHSGDGEHETTYLTRHLHATVDGVQILEEV